MRENTEFPKAIVKYISTTEIKNLEGDGFLLLIEIFDPEKFKEVADDKFVDALFNGIEYIKDENVVLCIVNIMINISCQTEDPTKNIVLKFCGTHQYRRYVAECTLLLLNKGKSTFLDKTLRFVKDVFKNDSTKNDFFYGNDLNSLIDIAIREFTNSESVDLKVTYLEVLEGIF